MRRHETYPYPSAERYMLSRDGQVLMTGTEQECWSYLHQHTSCSVWYALTCEGYKMEATQ